LRSGGLLRDHRYREELKNLPPPGTGCHPKLLSVANLGRSAGHSPDRVFADIRKAIPPGARVISDNEIMDAIEKAFDNSPRTTAGRILGPSSHGRSAHDPRVVARQSLVAQPQGLSLQDLIRDVPPVDLVELSRRGPAQGCISLPTDVRDHSVVLLQALYAPHEMVFIATRYDAGAGSIMTASEWTRKIHAAMVKYGGEHEQIAGWFWPHVIPNPLTGQLGPTKAGKPSLRCDATVAAHRFALLEFDELGKDDQLRVLRALKLPVAAVIDTGGKSLHAWLRLDLPDAAAWDRVVRQDLFPCLLEPLGADPACKNPSRLSRLPGVARVDKGSVQKLLYLNINGGVI
jgi:hypothetical protein